MEFFFVKYLETLLLPPGGLLLLAIAGLLVLRVKLRWGVALLSVSLGLFYVLSTPLVSGWLLRSVEVYPALNAEQIKNTEADAIVLLAGGRLREQPEYGGDTVSHNSLQRLRYAAWLKRRTHLPLYISGGAPLGEAKSEAELMQEVLQKEFNVEVNVLEALSKTTYENAKFTAALLKQNGHRKILLVSNSFHMPRAVEAFQQFGVEVIAAPTVFNVNSNMDFSFRDILPFAKALEDSRVALHELFGRLWYKLRYYK